MVRVRREHYIQTRQEQLKPIIQKFSDKESIPQIAGLKRKDLRILRDFLVQKFQHVDVPSKNTIRLIYKKLSFLKSDLRCLRSRIWWRKVHAIERLYSLNMVEAEDDMITLLNDKNPLIRYSAIQFLSSMKSTKLYDRLDDLFLSDTRWNYRFLVRILYDADIPVDYLGPFARSPDRDLRKAAAILLGRKHNKAGTAILAKLMRDDIKDVRRESVKSLGRIALPEVIPLLLDKVSDQHPQVREEVARSCTGLKDDEVTSALEKLADDPVFDVRFQALKALRSLGQVGLNIAMKHSDKSPDIIREILSC